MHHLFSDPSLSLIKVDQHTTFSIVSHLLIVLNKRDLRPDPAQGDPAGPITLPPGLTSVQSTLCRGAAIQSVNPSLGQLFNGPATLQFPTCQLIFGPETVFMKNKFYWTSVNITDSRGQSLVSNVIM